MEIISSLSLIEYNTWSHLIIILGLLENSKKNILPSSRVLRALGCETKCQASIPKGPTPERNFVNIHVAVFLNIGRATRPSEVGLTAPGIDFESRKRQQKERTGLRFPYIAFNKQWVSNNQNTKWVAGQFGTDTEYRGKRFFSQESSVKRVLS